MDIDAALIALHKRIGELPYGPPGFLVPWATYWLLWDAEERWGYRPIADSFHGRVRRRLAKELAACLW